MDAKKNSLPRIVRRRALLRMRHRKCSKAAVKRTIKAQIAIKMATRTPMRPALLLDYKLPDVFPPKLAGKVLTVMATMR